MADQIPDSLLKSILSPILQPGAQLQETQAQIPNTQQSTATSAQEQQNMAAQNPGIQAQASTQQVENLQKKAQLGLSSDLKNKMTLGGAVAKYTALGMSPDDIFNQYLAQSPWGTPHESPDQLQKMGVSAKALGDIGTPGSFMDKYNTRNAIQSLRGLQGTWDDTSAAAHIPGVAQLDPSARAYESQKQFVGEHLSSLVPGASNGEQSAQGFLSALPSAGDIGAPASAQEQFKKVEDALLQSKGYSLSDLGLKGTPEQQKQNKGSDVLNGILQAALPTVGGAAGATAGALGGAMIPGADLTGVPEVAGAKLGGGVGAAGGQYLADIASGNKPGVDVAGAGLLGGILGKVPLNKALAPGAVEGLPTALRSYMNPDNAMTMAGNVRDKVVADATQAGKTIAGGDIVNGLKEWAQTAKKGNILDADKIDQAVTDAKKIFKGDLTPQEALDAYRSADSGYTKSGIAKAPVNAVVDRGLRDVLQAQLQKVAPGWQEATQSMSKTYDAANSPIRTGVKNVAKLGLPYLVGAGGADLLSHILFGK